jgi:aminoglycoside phosphotransferase (APT) family kinase protein
MQTTEERLQRIQNAFPDLEIRSVDENYEGLVNDVIVINGERICRFAKADWAIPLMGKEGRILHLVRSHVPVNIPYWDYMDEDFISYQRLPGQPMRWQAVRRMAEVDQDALAEQLALFYRGLREIPRAALDAEDIGNSDAVRTPDIYAGYYEKAQQLIYPSIYTHMRDTLDEIFQPVLNGSLSLEYEPRLIHADGGPHHILFNDQTRRIESILDFGTGGLGDPAMDIGVTMSCYGESFVRRMARYDRDIPEMIERARFYAAEVEVWWVLMGLERDEPSWMFVHLMTARDWLPPLSGWTR